MAIFQSDLKLLKAQDQTDTASGGGLPSSEVVVDGQSNNLFEDVSDIDAVNGRVRLKKVFLSVESENTDQLLASRLLVSEVPDNPNVSVFVFKPSYWADRRPDAKNRLEQYLAKGVKIAGHLLETQLEGQRAIQQVMRPSDTLPAVGDALVLVQNEGQADEFSQFVRVTEISSETRTFAVNTNTDVSRRVVTFSISEPLRFEFNGLTVANFERNSFNKQRTAYLRDARVADANKFFSAAKIVEPITALSTNEARLETIFTNVVPSTQSPQTFAQLDPSSRSGALTPASDSNVSLSVNGVSVTAGQRLYAGSPIYPDSLTLTLTGGIAMAERGGVLKDDQGEIYGNVEYASGSIIWAAGVSLGTRNVVMEFKPAGVTNRINRSESLQVPEVGANFNYITTLEMELARGSVEVSYEVSEQVYRLYDDGRGGLVSLDGAGGAGSIDYESGTVSITTGAIPDSLSLIIISYGSTINLKPIPKQTLEAFKYRQAIQPGAKIDSLSLSWDSDYISGTESASSDASGNITGNATGTFDPAARLLTLEFDRLPDPDTPITYSYDYGPVDSVATDINNESAQSSGVFSVPGNGEIVPGTFSIELAVEAFLEDEGGAEKPDSSYEQPIKLIDDGDGVLKAFYLTRRALGIQTVSSVGTVNYQTRELTIDLSALNKDLFVKERVAYSPPVAYSGRIIVRAR